LWSFAVIEAHGLAPKEITEQKRLMSDTIAHFGGTDLFTNDPFCKIQVGNRSSKTTAKHNTLNPKWNDESFILYVARFSHHDISPFIVTVTSKQLHYLTSH
jgi:hypothetical protein